MGQKGQWGRLHGGLGWEEKGLWQQPGGRGLVGGSWQGRRDVPWLPPCTRCWGGTHCSSWGGLLPTGTLYQGQTWKMFCSSMVLRVPALHTSDCSMLSNAARVCGGHTVLWAALEAWAGQGQLWPFGAQERISGWGSGIP